MTELQTPLTEIEKAELLAACQLALKPVAVLMLRRCLFQLDAELGRAVPATLSLHRCKICGTRWLLWPDEITGGGWNLLDKYQRPGSCCDNVAMGDQIEHLRDIPLTSALPAMGSPQQELKPHKVLASYVLGGREASPNNDDELLAAIHGGIDLSPVAEVRVRRVFESAPAATGSQPCEECGRTRRCDGMPGSSWTYRGQERGLEQAVICASLAVGQPGSTDGVMLVSDRHESFVSPPSRARLSRSRTGAPEVSKPDYDTTLARIAGNIMAGLVNHPDYGPTPAAADRAIECAIWIVQRLKLAPQPTEPDR